MGFSNRDYMRDDTNSAGPAWAHDVPTTKWLLIITVAVFFSQSIFTHRGHVSYVEEWFGLEADKVWSGQIWRLVTYVFCHHRDNPFSLVFNMVGLWYLGSVLERMYGSRELLWFYLASAVVCGAVFAAFGLKMMLPMPLIGAGPCVMALLTLYATHFPYREILFFFIVPIQIWVLLVIYVFLDGYQILNAVSGQAPWVQVAYTAELWGMAFGYLYRRFDWHLNGLAQTIDLRRTWNAWRKARSSRHLKVFHPEPTADLEAQVDALLAKIHEHGSESLTDRERSILQKASARAKNRL